jgi:hypothetical protein
MMIQVVTKGMTETILFGSTCLGLPDGHEWNSVAARCIYPLGAYPSCCLYMPWYVMHGSLPSHSMEATEKHDGIGSTIVMKHDMVEGGLLEAKWMIPY